MIRKHLEMNSGTHIYKVLTLTNLPQKSPFNIHWSKICCNCFSFNFEFLFYIIINIKLFIINLTHYLKIFFLRKWLAFIYFTMPVFMGIRLVRRYRRLVGISKVQKWADRSVIWWKLLKPSRGLERFILLPKLREINDLIQIQSKVPNSWLNWQIYLISKFSSIYRCRKYSIDSRAPYETSPPHILEKCRSCAEFAWVSTALLSRNERPRQPFPESEWLIVLL